MIRKAGISTLRFAETEQPDEDHNPRPRLKRCYKHTV
jgi:hypothetical protein